MIIRDRIRELRRVRAAELRPNPRNWRTHPPAQRDALRGLLQEVGYADALLARELPDGSLQLIDGHLRAETTPDALVPVLVVDVDEAEADKLLAALDPLAALAGRDQQQLTELLARVTTDSAELSTLFDALAQQRDEVLRQSFDTLAPTTTPADSPSSSSPIDTPTTPVPEQDLSDSYQLVVQCADEADQRTLFDRLTSEGYRCRVLVI